ncbi:MAG: hypothetical protein KIS78_07965 [Labilithrix sp.]|nr:hypothetical protein [Labilithrix sp.]
MHEPEEEGSIEVAEPSVDVSALLGPSSVPAPLHGPMPRDEHGRVDWVRLHHAMLAIENLLAAGMVGHARTVVAEAKAIVESTMPRHAEVVALNPRSR